MNNNKILILSALFVSISFYSQKSAVYNSEQLQYQKAIDLYENYEYAPALVLFNKVLNESNDEYKKANSSYYIAQSSIRLNQPQSDQLMKSFVEDYPAHPKINNAYLGAGNFYFSIGKYTVSRKWYEYVDVSSLNTSMQSQFYFNKGYALFKAKLYGESKKYLMQVLNSEQYKEKAMYYLGYISYNFDDYESASTFFNDVEAKEYSSDIHYFRADSNFKKGNYVEAIKIAEEQLNKSKGTDKSELHKIVGESYFKLEKYAESIFHLEQYKGKDGKWNNTDHFYLGFAYYNIGDYQKAVEQFNQIILVNDSVGQNAYYHLADAYLKLDKKTEALNAFKNAHEMKFDKNIQEDAFYNYAKLSYQIGNSFESVPSVLTSFIVSYPDSTHNEEINKFLVDSYFNLKNYKEALRILELTKNYKGTKLYQNVLFYRGLELFKDKDYEQALKMFEKSSENKVDDYLYQRTLFWKAESLYEKGDYDLAVAEYAKIKLPTEIKHSEFYLIKYQIGYCYFKTKDYLKAITYFKDFKIHFKKKYTDMSYYDDTILRLGDSYYVSGKYWKAVETYEKALVFKIKHADYAKFQKGISYGFVDRNWNKIEELENLIVDYPKSSYVDDAYYEIANTYVAENNTFKGLQSYKTLQQNFPKSPLVPKAMLKEGLIYYNDDQSEKALTIFKNLVDKYPKSAESLQAVNTCRLVYIDLGRTKEYAKWVKSLDFIEITNEQLDNDAYEAAEKPYLDNDLERAISGFKEYLSEFPKGLHTLDAQFYLAECYSKQSIPDKALPFYLQVAEVDKNQYTETVLYRVSEIFLAQKQYDNATPYLEKLENLADFNQNVVFAQSNLMKCYYEQNQYLKTLNYANKVLLNSDIDQNVKNDAQLYKARAAFTLDSLEESKLAYTEVSKSAKGALAAEAIYYLAFFSNKDLNYEESNKYVQILAKDYSTYREFGAKGLVLMAKNFYSLNDAYQATYLLQSVIDNFTEFPDVIENATNILNKIKEEEAKVNSSINNN